jgi:transporter family-2 protein
MTAVLFLIFIAALAGVASSLQGQFMGIMDRRVGTATGVFITYGVGAVAATIFWLARRGSLATARQIPWYAWSAGALGLVIVGGIGYAATRLGLSRTMVITVAAQLLSALAIDHFGLFAAAPRPLDWWRALGVVLTVGGAWLIVRM